VVLTADVDIETLHRQYAEPAATKVEFALLVPAANEEMQLCGLTRPCPNTAVKILSGQLFEDDSDCREARGR